MSDHEIIMSALMDAIGEGGCGLSQFSNHK